MSSSKVGPDPRTQVATPSTQTPPDETQKTPHEGTVPLASGAILAGRAADAAAALDQTATMVDAASLGVEMGKAPSHRLGGILEKAGVAAVMASEAFKSDAETDGGKVVNAFSAGAAVSRMKALSNPVLAADFVMNVAGNTLLGEKAHKAMGGYISGHAASAAKFVTAGYESKFKGNDKMWNKVKQDALSGEMGAPIALAADTAQYWSQNGVKKGLSDAAEAFKSGGGMKSVVGFVQDRAEAAQTTLKEFRADRAEAAKRGMAYLAKGTVVKDVREATVAAATDGVAYLAQLKKDYDGAGGAKALATAGVETGKEVYRAAEDVAVTIGAATWNAAKEFFR